jgi:hypothetical protein
MTWRKLNEDNLVAMVAVIEVNPIVVFVFAEPFPVIVIHAVEPFKGRVFGVESLVVTNVMFTQRLCEPVGTQHCGIALWFIRPTLVHLP